MMENIQFSVLVVDDDISDLNALNNILKSNYTVYFAKSGHAAIKRAVENKPDIILLDVVMPDMDGYEVISELKKTDTACDIPVIFITSLNKVSDELTGFNLGAVDYITKPFHGAIVRARIEAHLNTVRQLGEKDSAAIPIKTRQAIRNVKFRELLYVEISGHWLKFHTTNSGTIEVYGSIKDYEGTLQSDPRFVRCHKSFIVNMDYVAVVEVREVLMKNGARLSISRGYAGFKKRYAEWIHA